MKIQITLNRPYDREPGDHLYGEPFDTEINNLIGGKSNWSSLPEDRSLQPSAKVYDDQISIVLHEDGPLIEFIIKSIDQIPAFISAISAVISAWAATRALRSKKIPDDAEFKRTSGTIVQIGEHRFESKNNLNPEKLKDITDSIARFSQKHVTDE